VSPGEEYRDKKEEEIKEVIYPVALMPFQYIYYMQNQGFHSILY
jgi:hypothetical protein